MNKDIKAIIESYGAGINNTTRNNDSYAYSVKDYGTMRNEAEEEPALKKKIAAELNNMTQRAARGLKEDYTYILTNMKRLHDDLASIINKV